MNSPQFVQLSKGTFTLAHCAAQFEEELEWDRRHQAQHAHKAPYKMGDVVYLKSLAGEDSLPTEFINKPLTIKSVWHVPGPKEDIWDLDLEGCPYMLTDKDVQTTKPF